MQRRDFLIGAAAVTGLGPAAAAAQEVQRAATPAFPDLKTPRYVNIRAGFAPNEIHLVPDDFALYWTLPNNQAIRYAVGVGRPGLYESGVFYVGAKKQWPDWTPTPEMIEREPELYEQWADGMPGGPGNPLGARALYLFERGRGDTFLRIHGTDQPQTIGRAVSNGCARLVNAHVIELYDRVPIGARVVLYPKRTT